MTLDKVTEMVAHMIGIFQTEIEDQRLRDVYTAFKALSAENPEGDPITSVAVEFKAPYELGGFTPNIDYANPPPAAPMLDPMAPGFLPTGAPITFYDYFPEAVQGLLTYSAPMFGGFGRPFPALEPPGSVAVITVQTAILFDDDWLIMGDGSTSFADPATFLNELLFYQVIADSMTASLGADPLFPGPDALDDAVALHAAASAFSGGAITVGTEYVAHGTDAFAQHLNGDTVTDLPALDDQMPAYLKMKAGQDDNPPTGGEEDAEEAHEWPDPFAGLSDADADQPYRPGEEGGNLVVAGGNTMINQVSISSAWLDAPVIAVMGDVAHLNVIAQVNVMVQHATGSIGAATASASFNSAALTQTATTPEADPAQAEAAGPPSLPSYWAVTRIEGDLISVNHVSQFSFQSDHDRAEIAFSSSDTFIGLGDNTIVNLTDLAELGFGYDLILVGGAMISVNWIQQTNVLIDNDAVTYAGAIPGGVQLGDNLLFNAAQIGGTGIDQYGAMQDNFAKAAGSLADGAQTIGADVARDTLFEGVEALRVLYIEGDMTTVNWLEQTNILGDSDQVHMALDDFQAATGATAEVVTGSNALINLADITQYGTDSTVMVAGDVYDDALLYQAELIDTDADPLGVEMPGLAPSAVAFLADDMLGPDDMQIDTPILPTPAEGHASPDMMQTMLA